MIILCDNEFNTDGYWSIPVSNPLYVPSFNDLALFDQNGYDLTEVEKKFADSNMVLIKSHRDHIHAIKQDWFLQPISIEGPVLNHALLFERKAYAGEALFQIKQWALELPLLNKIIAIRPKWGLDFSMDYVDRAGNSLEVLHWEWDSFDYKEICDVKAQIEPILQKIDWNDAAKYLLIHKDEWIYLDFFAQSTWKCKYFGIIEERFKMVIWK